LPASVELARQPIGSRDHTIRQKLDVEPEMAGLRVDRFFLRGEEIHQQGPQTRTLEDPRDIAIAAAVAAAATPVREYHDSGAPLRDRQIALQNGGTRRNRGYLLLFHRLDHWHH
jgi:hypothetical protein